MPIRIRLALLFAFGTALVIAVGGAIFVHELSAGLRSSMIATLRARADVIDQNLPENQASPSGPIGQAAGAGQSATQDSTGSQRTTGTSGPDLQAGGASSQSGTQQQFPPPPSVDEGGFIAQLLDRRGRVIAASNASSTVPILNQGQLKSSLSHDLLFERRFPKTRDPVLLLARPIEDQPGSVVVSGATLGTVDQTIGRVEGALVIGGPLGVLVAGLAAWLLAGAALAPVARMRRQADEISEKDQCARLAVPSTRDEIAGLAHTLNALLERLQGALGRQRGFVAAASHELRTPLAILRSELELASRPGRSRQGLREAVHEAVHETERLVALSEDLLVLARNDEASLSLELKVQELEPVVARSADAFRVRAREADVRIVVESGPPVVVAVDEQRLRQVLDNLIDNALRFAPPGSQIELRITAGHEHVLVQVLDSGPGFLPEFLSQAFDRFSRPDAARDREHGGAGLGLAIVKSLMEAHHGSVQARNRPQGGASLELTLPIVLR